MKRYRATPVRIDRKSSRREINNFVAFLRLFTLHFFLHFFFSAVSTCVNFFFFDDNPSRFFSRIIIIQRNNCYNKMIMCFEIFRDCLQIFLNCFKFNYFYNFIPILFIILIVKFHDFLFIQLIDQLSEEKSF